MTSDQISNRHDETYHSLLERILAKGELRKNRTGVDTISIFGDQIAFDLKETFPALTTKRMAWRAIVSELLWFLAGSDDERFLAHILYLYTKTPFDYFSADYDSVEKEEQRFKDSIKTHKTIWTDNVQADSWKANQNLFIGNTGRIYGVQWRHWTNSEGKRFDQVANLIEGLKKDPMGRRHIITAWNPGELDQMCLPPCHILAQFYVTNDGYLECHMYQRSVDTFLGLPFNIASYSLLVHIISQLTGLKPGRLVMSLGDVHIYSDHMDQVKEQLARKSRPEPTLTIPNLKNVPLSSMYELVSEFTLNNYIPHPSIKAPMAV
jgi:thymidylate synthase